MASVTPITVPAEPLERFKQDLNALVSQGTTIGIAVSGGADSLALLLLAAQARPLEIEAATVDHAFRPESRVEAGAVGELCERLGVPHRILTAKWDEQPKTAIQERARLMRYQLLGGWARERNIGALLIGHHLDDQAETFLMRLNRGAGVKGLSGMRRFARSPSGNVALVRPFLGWRHVELEEVCALAGVTPFDDPSNDNLEFERVRVRQALREADWLDPVTISQSAAHLAEADAALHWASTLEWQRNASLADGQIVYRPSDAPREIRRRMIRRAILALASEGQGVELRGRELDQILAALVTGRKATLRGVVCTGGKDWRFAPAPSRRAEVQSAEIGAVEA